MSLERATVRHGLVLPKRSRTRPSGGAALGPPAGGKPSGGQLRHINKMGSPQWVGGRGRRGRRGDGACSKSSRLCGGMQCNWPAKRCPINPRHIELPSWMVGGCGPGPDGWRGGPTAKTGNLPGSAAAASAQMPVDACCLSAEMHWGPPGDNSQNSSKVLHRSEGEEFISCGDLKPGRDGVQHGMIRPLVPGSPQSAQGASCRGI